MIEQRKRILMSPTRSAMATIHEGAAILSPLASVFSNENAPDLLLGATSMFDNNIGRDFGRDDDESRQSTVH